MIFQEKKTQQSSTSNAANETADQREEIANFSSPPYRIRAACPGLGQTEVSDGLDAVLACRKKVQEGDRTE